MKSSVQFKALATVTTFTTVTLLSLSILANRQTEAGLISFLKGDGDKTKESEPAVQKVGFFGCATVREVSGNVEYLDGIDKWLPLAPGKHLKEGDILRTRQGHVVIQMCESDSLVKVTPQIVARLLALDQSGDRGIISGSEQREGYLVRSLHGKAYFKDGSAAWKPVRVNEVLPEGTLVRTEPAASMQVVSTKERRAMRLDPAGEVLLGSHAL